MFDFFKRHKNKVMATAGVASAVSVLSTVSSFATSNPTYTPKPVPTAQTMDLSLLGNLWNYAQSMLQDVISIISSQPLLVVMVIALPLIGIGIGLFKRIIN